MPLIGTRGAASVRGFGGFNVPEQYWFAELNSASSTWYGVAKDTAGYLYPAGALYKGASQNDCVIAKYNSVGVVQWQKSLGGVNNNYFTSTAVDTSNNIYCGGVVNNDILVVKYNTSGVLQWQNKLASTPPAADIGRAVAVDASNNVYVVGSTTISGYKQGVIAKYNTSGAIQWQRTLSGGITNVEFYGVAIDSSNNVYVVGERDATGEVITVKYNSAGTIQWQRELFGANDSGRAVAVDSAANVYVLASGGGGGTTLLIKYNTSGTLQWQKSINQPTAAALAVDTAQNICVLVSSGDAYVVKFDSSGALLWQRSLTTLYLYSITTTINNSIVLGGERSTIQSELALLPYDGGRLGTYNVGVGSLSPGTVTYAVSSLTISTSTRTSVTSTLVDAAGSLTASSATLTAATQTFVPSLTYI
jgi:hypothetical protein